MESFSVQGNRPVRKLFLVGLVVLVLLVFAASGDRYAVYAFLLALLVFLVLAGLVAWPVRWRVEPSAGRMTRTDWGGLRRRVVEASEVSALELLLKNKRGVRRLVLRRRRASPIALRTGRDLLSLRRDGRLIARALRVPLMEPDPETGSLSDGPHRFWLEPGVRRKPTEVPNHAVLVDLAYSKQAWSFAIPLLSDPTRSHGFQVTSQAIFYTTPEGETHRFELEEIDGIASVERHRAQARKSYLGILTRAGLVNITGIGSRPAGRGKKAPQAVVAEALLSAVRDLKG